MVLAEHPAVSVHAAMVKFVVPPSGGKNRPRPELRTRRQTAYMAPGRCRRANRLKGYGRRWDRPNASAIAALDTLDRSGQWHTFWPNASTVTT